MSLRTSLAARLRPIRRRRQHLQAVPARETRLDLLRRARARVDEARTLRDLQERSTYLVYALDDLLAAEETRPRPLVSVPWPRPWRWLDAADREALGGLALRGMLYTCIVVWCALACGLAVRLFLLASGRF